jgi:hypothetical protein
MTNWFQRDLQELLSLILIELLPSLSFSLFLFDGGHFKLSNYDENMWFHRIPEVEYHNSTNSIVDIPENWFGCNCDSCIGWSVGEVMRKWCFDECKSLASVTFESVSRLLRNEREVLRKLDGLEVQSKQSHLNKLIFYDILEEEGILNSYQIMTNTRNINWG